MVMLNAEGQDFMRLIGFLAAILAASGANARQAPPSVPLPAALAACISMVSDADRLRCYDTAVSALSADARAVAQRREAEAATAAAAAAAEARAAAERQAAFGSETLPAALQPEGERIQQLEARVTETFMDGRNRAVLVLDNGQIWRQTEGVMLPAIRVDTDVVLKRGPLGSYRMTIERIRRTFSVSRIR